MRNLLLLAMLPIVLALAFGAALVQGADETAFDDEINVSADTIGFRLTSADSRQIAVFNGTIYQVWQGGGDIWLRFNRDEGATWDPPLTDPAYNLSGDDSDPGDTASQSAQIAVSGDGYVHVVWRQYTGAGYEVFYQRLTDTSTHFLFELLLGDGGLNLSNRPLISSSMQIAASDDNVYVV